MTLEESIKKVVKRMEAFRHSVMVALGREFSVDEEDVLESPSPAGWFLRSMEEERERIERVNVIPPPSVAPWEWNDVTPGVPTPIPSFDAVEDFGIRTIMGDPMPPPQQFEFTNELYHLIMECTEVILEYCRENNITPSYSVHLVGLTGVVISISRRWSRAEYTISTKEQLPKLEEFLRGVYEKEQEKRP